MADPLVFFDDEPANGDLQTVCPILTVDDVARFPRSPALPFA